MPPERSEGSPPHRFKAPAAPSPQTEAAGAAEPPSLLAATRVPHRVARFHRIPVQQAEEWCWAAVCLAILRWRGVPAALCDVVRQVRGEACTRYGLGCYHRECRQPESLARALRLLDIPYLTILPANRWAASVAALQADHLVACEIALEGTSHAVLLTSVSPATAREPAWIGVDDPLPLRNERRIARLYQGGFRPTFLAMVG